MVSSLPYPFGVPPLPDPFGITARDPTLSSTMVVSLRPFPRPIPFFSHGSLSLRAFFSYFPYLWRRKGKRVKSGRPRVGPDLCRSSIVSYLRQLYRTRPARGHRVSSRYSYLLHLSVSLLSAVSTGGLKCTRSGRTRSVGKRMIRKGINDTRTVTVKGEEVCSVPTKTESRT